MSARRAARAATGVAETPGDRSVVELLRDPSAPVWADHGAFVALVSAQGWDVGMYRWHAQAHPANRRNRAARVWALRNGVTPLDHLTSPDLHALRRMGLYG